MKEPPKVIIRQVYKGYTPPVRLDKTVDRLLSGIPRKHIAGLNTVVITNFACLSHNERKGKTKSRGRKVSMIHCLGRYQPASRGRQAWIQLFADTILKNWPAWVLRIRPLQDFAIADTLFHEIGHHIHETQSPQHKNQENVADDWGRKLSGQYFRRHYWYLLPLVGVLLLIMTPIAWTMKKLRKAKKRVGRARPDIDKTDDVPPQSEPQVVPRSTGHHPGDYE